MLRFYEMKKWQRLISGVGVLILITSFAVSACAQSPAEPKKDDTPFPAYGNGKIKVRIYTDYFCPPCQASEPKIEPVIEKLIKQGVITVTFIDTPVHPHSSLYAKYFLYVLKTKNTFAHAILVRRALFEAAKKQIIDKDKLETHLKQKGIAFKAFDVKPAFIKLNNLLINDKIASTPSCVIEINGKSKTFVGGETILNALNALK